jgi:hypothetical protein
MQRLGTKSLLQYTDSNEIVGLWVDVTGMLREIPQIPKKLQNSRKMAEKQHKTALFSL